VYSKVKALDVRSSFAIRRFTGLQHLYVWGISLFAAVLPVFLGQFHPEHGSECYMTDTRAGSRVFIVFLWSFYVIFALALLLQTYCTSKSDSLLPDSIRQQFLARMSFFIGIFSISWGFVCVYDWWNFFTERQPPPPLWMTWTTLCLIYGSGFSNCLVWLSAPAFRKEFARWRKGEDIYRSTDE